MKNIFVLLMLTACSQEADTNTTKTEVGTKKTQTKSKTGDHHGTHGNHGSTDEVQIGPVPEGAKVFFKSPANGATVSSPVSIQMGVEGMKVVPAGPLKDGTGHHHIIVDAPAPKKGEVVPADKQHIHFGKGQTEATLELTPGKHTLRLQFANGAHFSYGPQLSSSIEITVE